jgi:7-cyano-7-deazaguanine synthase in queuosine biosynthesis
VRKRCGDYCVRVRGTGVRPQMKLVSGVDFNLDEANISDSLSLPLNRLEHDLIRVGMGVYAVDRLVRRSDFGDDRPACRELELVVEVSDPDFWNTQSARISEILSFLDGGVWTLSFEGGAKPLYLPPFLWEPPVERSLVCLYSGGLDSTAGLAIRRAEVAGDLFAVTALHQPHQQKRVRSHHRRTATALGVGVTPVLSKTTLINPPRLDRQELSQRCRAFLFCSLAGAVASRVRAEEIELYESGVGVLNLPPMTGMLWGGRATRGCHPRFMRMIGDLVSCVAGRRVRFALPFKRWTKAEMVRRFAGLGLTPAIADSVSCVHYPLRIGGRAKQCGLCPGCLSRRQAVLASGVDIGLEADGFQHDILDVSCNRLPAERLAFLREQVLQVADLHELAADASSPEILRRHLSTSGAVTLADPAEDWAVLLGRFRDEWMRVIAIARERGCRWASWIDGYGRGGREVRHGGTDERINESRSEELRGADCPVP